MKTFKSFNEDVGNSVTGIAGAAPGDEPPGKKGQFDIVRRKFAGVEVFEVTNDIYHKCLWGKTKHSRYNKYVGDDSVGQAIREYGRTNPKSSIILKNSQTGSMIYFKKDKLKK